MSEWVVDEAKRARWERLLMEPGWIVALYPGSCILCGTPWLIGAPIRRADFEPGWLADCCAETT
jgi:hypothetical protein